MEAQSVRFETGKEASQAFIVLKIGGIAAPSILGKEGGVQTLAALSTDVC